MFISEKSKINWSFNGEKTKGYGSLEVNGTKKASIRADSVKTPLSSDDVSPEPILFSASSKPECSRDTESKSKGDKKQSGLESLRIKFYIGRVSSLSNSIKMNVETLFRKNSSGKIDVSNFKRIADSMSQDFSTMLIFIEKAISEKNMTKNQYRTIHAKIKLVEQELLKCLLACETAKPSAHEYEHMVALQRGIERMFQHLQECKSAFMEANFC